MSANSQTASEVVCTRANILHIPLQNFVKKITKQYVNGGVTGFEFIPKNYEDYLKVVDIAVIQKALGDDDKAGVVGAVMGSVAHSDGYAMTVREKTFGSSLHLELGKKKCDAHIDSHGICHAQQKHGVPLYAGQYDPTSFFDHGLKDLLPSMLGMKGPSRVLNAINLNLRVDGKNQLSNGVFETDSLVDASNKTVNQPASQAIISVSFISF